MRAIVLTMTKQKRLDHNLALVDHHLFVNPQLRIAPFQPLISVDSRLVHVDIEESYPAMVAVIPAISSKPHRAAIAHP